MIELITGRAAKAHIDSADIGAFNAGFLGKGSYILDGCKVTTPTANSVNIAAGGFVIEGRYVRVTGAGETVSLDSGASSYKRMDLLVAHYKRLSDDTESVVFEIVKGKPVDSSQTPKAPTVPTASILDGNADVEVPFAQILIDGLAPKLDKMLVNSGAWDIVQVKQINAPAVSVYRCGNVVWLTFGATGQEIGTWGAYQLASGLPKPASSHTTGVCYSQGSGQGEHMILIDLDSVGGLYLRAKGFGTPAGWHFGSMAYITSEGQ